MKHFTHLAITVIAVAIASFAGYKIGLENGVEASENISIGKSHRYTNEANKASSKGDQVEAALYHGLALGAEPSLQSIYEAWSYFKSIKRIDLAETIAQNINPSTPEEMAQLKRLMELGK